MIVFYIRRLSLISSIRSFSLFNIQTLKRPIFPELNDKDIIENHLKGSGPGGQNVNKSTNCVQLIHKPTGLIAVSHHSRRLIDNQKTARKILQEKLDLYYNKENSYLAQLKREKQIEKQEKAKKAIKNLEKKRKFKEENNLE